MSPWYGRDGFVTYRPAPDRRQGTSRAVYLRICGLAFAVGLLSRLSGVMIAGQARETAAESRDLPRFIGIYYRRLPAGIMIE
jgi:hypothetical protein